MSDRVLVTGATGFVGSAVTRRLLQAGLRVRVLVRESSRRDNLHGLDVEPVVGDLRQRATLASAVAGCRGVFHVAADYRLWTRQPDAMYASNVDGSYNVVRAALAAGVERVVYTSSVATLGLNADGTAADEDAPVTLAQMIGHYKRSKFLAEQTVCTLAAKEHLDLIVTHPAAPVGPRDIKPTPTGRTILDAARGRMPAYVDTGLDIVHVDDVAEGHVLAWQHGQAGRHYILGGENLSLREILARVAAITGRSPPRLRLPHAALVPAAALSEGWARLSGHTPALTLDGVKLARKHMYFTHARAEHELGYHPRPAQQALDDAVRWFGEHGYF